MIRWRCCVGEVTAVIVPEGEVTTSFVPVAEKRSSSGVALTPVALPAAVLGLLLLEGGLVGVAGISTGSAATAAYDASLLPFPFPRLDPLFAAPTSFLPAARVKVPPICSVLDLNNFAAAALLLLLPVLPPPSPSSKLSGNATSGGTPTLVSPSSLSSSRLDAAGAHESSSPLLQYARTVPPRASSERTEERMVGSKPWIRRNSSLAICAALSRARGVVISSRVVARPGEPLVESIPVTSDKMADSNSVGKRDSTKSGNGSTTPCTNGLVTILNGNVLALGVLAI